MSSQEAAFMPMDAIPRAAVPAVAQASGSSVPASIGRQFALLIVASIALFGGLPLWLELIVDSAPTSVNGEWNAYWLLVAGGAFGALVISLIVASTWIRLVKRLACTDWNA
jgi:hypothetical protein